VTIDGRDAYLSREAYRRTIIAWTQGGGHLPAAKYASSVSEIVRAYTELATRYYPQDGKPTDEVRMIKSAIKIARRPYGHTPAIEFGPLALKACRQKMIEKD
jgi:hypothetical protein